MNDNGPPDAIPTFEELASAVEKAVPHDRITLHLPDRKLEHGTGTRAPIATIIIPLFAGGALVGRLHVTRASSAFTQDERASLAYLSPHLAVSAHSIAEIEARRRLLDEAEAVLEIGRATASLFDPKEVVSRALDVVGRYLPLPVQFAVFGDPDDQQRWHLLGARSADPTKLAALGRVTLRVEDLGPERAKAVLAGDPWYVSDVQMESSLCGELGRSFGVRAVLAAPLRSGEQTLGVVMVCSPSHGRVFLQTERVLIRGVADQVSISLRNARLVRENLRVVEDLRALSRRLWSVQEEERERIARELHDEAGQAMTALKLHLDLARREPDLERVKARIADAVELAGDVLVELRRITGDLRPGGLHELGLVPALHALVQGFGRRTGLAAEFETTTDVVPHPESDAASTTFRFVQEALTNVARHAQAKSVRVTLEAAPGGQLRVIVEDDGVGFEAGAALDGHFGLVGMRERARLLGGNLTLQTSSGRGARLALELPA